MVTLLKTEFVGVNCIRASIFIAFYLSNLDNSLCINDILTKVRGQIRARPGLFPNPGTAHLGPRISRTQTFLGLSSGSGPGVFPKSEIGFLKNLGL